MKGLAFGVGLELSGADLWLAVGQLTLNLMKQQSEPQQRVPAPAEPQQELSFAGIAEGMLTAPAKDYQEYLRLIRLGGKENAFRAGQIAGSYSIRIGGLLTGVGIGKAILTKGGERLVREGVENAAQGVAKVTSNVVASQKISNSRALGLFGENEPLPKNRTAG